MKSREQRGSAKGGEASTPTQNRGDEEKEEVPTLQRRTRKSRAGMTPVEQRPCIICAVEDSEVEHAMGVALADEVAPIIKTNMPDMVLPTWAFMAWVLEAIPAARLRQYQEQKTVPKMHRWLSDKVERDLEQVFKHVETQRSTLTLFLHLWS